MSVPVWLYGEPVELQQSTALSSGSFFPKCEPESHCTLHIGAPSLSDHSVCVLCRVTQSTHTGSSSFSQYSCSGFRCRLQVSSPGPFRFAHQFDCRRKLSHALLSARLEVTRPSSHTSLHTGQFLLTWKLFCRHSRQKLWEHGSSTGSWKTAWHTGQVRSCRKGIASSGMSSSMASRARFSLLSVLKNKKEQNTHPPGSVWETRSRLRQFAYAHKKSRKK